MDWKDWDGKHIFVKLRDGAVYSGEVIDVDISGGTLIWITIIDKKNEKVTFVHSEIIKIKEEKNENR